MRLHHDGPHHLIVLVGKDVAVVDEAGVLKQICLRDCEERSMLFTVVSINKLFVGHM